MCFSSHTHTHTHREKATTVVTVGEMALRVAVGVVEDGFLSHVQQLAPLDARSAAGQLLGQGSDWQQRGLRLAAHSHAHRGELHAICPGTCTRSAQGEVRPSHGQSVCMYRIAPDGRGGGRNGSERERERKTEVGR